MALYALTLGRRGWTRAVPGLISGTPYMQLGAIYGQRGWPFGLPIVSLFMGCPDLRRASACIPISAGSPPIATPPALLRGFLLFIARQHLDRKRRADVIAMKKSAILGHVTRVFVFGGVWRADLSDRPFLSDL